MNDEQLLKTFSKLIEDISLKVINSEALLKLRVIEMGLDSTRIKLSKDLKASQDASTSLYKSIHSDLTREVQALIQVKKEIEFSINERLSNIDETVINTSDTLNKFISSNKKTVDTINTLSNNITKLRRELYECKEESFIRFKKQIRFSRTIVFIGILNFLGLFGLLYLFYALSITLR